jgi:uncharacterized protein YcgL (UPF0745 family)
VSETLTCYIYRSPRKVDTYLYLAEKNGFDAVPVELLQAFGTPEFCFELELTPNRRLAREDPAEVRAHLLDQGYHLQVQDDLTIEQQLALKSLN